MKETAISDYNIIGKELARLGGKPITFSVKGRSVILSNGEKELVLVCARRANTFSMYPNQRTNRDSSREYHLCGEVDNHHHTEIDIVVNVFEDEQVLFADFPPSESIKKHFEE